jgi:RNA polymerase sigma-70 factor (ECF subfamily)
MTDEQAFVSRIKNGDKQAFRLLIQQHERLVGHMIGRLIKQSEDREELCQDVFLKVFDRISEFNFQSKLSTWIASIAYRHAINHLRKQKMEYSEFPGEETWTDRFVEREDPEDIMTEKDMDQWVIKLIDQLPVQYKTVLTLYHLDGMNYAEIGSVTEMPEGTIKNYLFRARQLLKEKVKNQLGE